MNLVGGGGGEGPGEGASTTTGKGSHQPHAFIHGERLGSMCLLPKWSRPELK